MKLLIVDDSKSIRDSLAGLVSGIQGIKVIDTASGVDEAEKYIHQGWDFVGSLTEKKVILKLPH